MVRSRPQLQLLALLTIVAGFCIACASASAASFALSMQDPRPYAATDADQAVRFDQMAGLGADVTRLTLRWNEIAAGCGGAAAAAPDTLRDPANSCYDWATTDRAVAQARARGISVLVSLYGTPSWVFNSNDPSFTGSARSDFNTFVARYADFAQAAATRFAAGSAIGTIDRWTIWNEPNGSTFWLPQLSDSATRYADLYVAAATRIKAASSTALVAPGPTAPNTKPQKPGTYIPQVQARLAQLGAGSLVDAWAHNPYPGGNVSPYKPVYKLPSIGIGNLDDLIDILDASSVTRGKPIWGTEFAYQTNPPDALLGTTPELQAQWMAEAMDVAWTSGRMPIFGWYVMQDPGGDPSADWDSGMFDATGAEKPAAAMYRRPVAVRKLADGTVRVWGMSGVDPDNGQLVQRASPDAAWTVLPAQRFDNGVLVAVGKLANGSQVAVSDSVGVGPTRSISSAWLETNPTRWPGAKVGSTRRATYSHVKPRLVVRQARTLRSTASMCGKSLRRRCIYRRPSTPALRMGLTASGRVIAQAQWQMRRGGKWRTFTRVHERALVTRGAHALTIPAAVRVRAGLFRVRLVSVKRNAATPSAWQFLHVQR